MSRLFGNFKAVDQVDLEIERATVFGFLGPNGSGKSTTIRMLLGLLTPSAGEIEVLGHAVPAQIGELRARFGYMTQRFSLYEDLTVEENLSFIASVYGFGRKAARQRIQALTQRYRLDRRRSQRAGAMSGGQRQRLALAAATLHRPELLFLDEPTSAVDPENRRDFWESLFDLAAEGTTILVSSHLMDEAERCHRLAILSAGRKVADGVPADLMRQLAGRTVAIETQHPRSMRDALLALDWVHGAAQVGKLLRVLVNERAQAPLQQVTTAARSVDDSAQVEAVPANLEDVFVMATAQAQRQ